MFNKLSQLATLVAIMLLASCSRPIAKFSYEMKQDVLPVDLSTSNLSTNGEEYRWYIDGEKVSEAIKSADKPPQIK